MKTGMVCVWRIIWKKKKENTDKNEKKLMKTPNKQNSYDNCNSPEYLGCKDENGIERNLPEQRTWYFRISETTFILLFVGQKLEKCNTCQDKTNNKVTSQPTRLHVPYIDNAVKIWSITLNNRREKRSHLIRFKVRLGHV